MKIIPNKIKGFFSAGWYKSPLKLILGCVFVVPFLAIALPYLLIGATKLSKPLKIVGYIVLTFLIFVWIGSNAPEVEDSQTALPSPSSEPTVVANDSSEDEVTESPEADLKRAEDFLVFYNHILELDNQGKKTYDDTTKKLADVISGNLSQPELYVAYKNGQETIQANSRDFSNVDIPDTLVNQREQLEYIKDRASTAHFAMSQSLGLQAEYLNTNDMKKFQDAEVQSQLYSEIMTDVTIKLIEASREAGVDPVTLPTK